jgi:hypothetical protein
MWIYTVFLFVVLGAIGFVMTGSLSALALILFICLTGGIGITLVTHNEFDAARRNGRPPRITRIFD